MKKLAVIAFLFTAAFFGGASLAGTSPFPGGPAKPAPLDKTPVSKVETATFALG